MVAFFIKIDLDCDTNQLHWNTRLETKYSFFSSEQPLKEYSIHKEDFLFVDCKALKVITIKVCVEQSHLIFYV